MNNYKRLHGGCTEHIAACYAEAIADEVPERVRELRTAAIRELQKYLTMYQNLGYDQRLIDGIAEKKCRMISTITSKSEMDRRKNLSAGTRRRVELLSEAKLSNGIWSCSVKSILKRVKRFLEVRYEQRNFL